MEVNRLLGWAVSKLKHHYERKHYTKIGSAQTIIDADSAAAMAKYLGNMRILHHEAAMSLDSSLKDIIFTELIRKVFHARINEVITKYRDEHFGRHSKKGDGGTTFRGFLRARTRKAAEKK